MISSVSNVAFGKTVFTGNKMAYANAFDMLKASADAMKNTADDRAVAFDYSLQEDGGNLVFTADNNADAERALTYGALVYQFMFDASVSPLLIQSDSLDREATNAVAQDVSATTSLNIEAMNYTFEALA